MHGECSVYETGAHGCRVGRDCLSCSSYYPRCWEGNRPTPGCWERSCSSVCSLSCMGFGCMDCLGWYGDCMVCDYMGFLGCMGRDCKDFAY